jgi:hypothetical protein
MYLVTILETIGDVEDHAGGTFEPLDVVRDVLRIPGKDAEAARNAVVEGEGSFVCGLVVALQRHKTTSSVVGRHVLLLPLPDTIAFGLNLRLVSSAIA